MKYKYKSITHWRCSGREGSSWQRVFLTTERRQPVCTTFTDETLQLLPSSEHLFIYLFSRVKMHPAHSHIREKMLISMSHSKWSILPVYHSTEAFMSRFWYEHWESTLNFSAFSILTNRDHLSIIWHWDVCLAWHAHSVVHTISYWLSVATL